MDADKYNRPNSDGRRAPATAKKAILSREVVRIREAYERIPDSAAEADDWSNCEEFEA